MTFNLKRKLYFISLFLISGLLSAQKDWKIVSEKILTPWAEQVDPSNPLPEYPRPQFVRENWQNLNGLWDYAIEEGKLKEIPKTFDGEILVPFPVESALSGVNKRVGKEKTLWYKKEIEVDKDLSKDKLLLHFGAVDWRTEVYVNGKKVGTHEGGFDPFTFDITDFLKRGKKQEVVIGVWDPTDDGPQPNGKQVNEPNGIWYTPVTGIWQTVWLESVPKTYIKQVQQTPDIDNNRLAVEAMVENPQKGDQLRLVILDKGKKINEISAPLKKHTRTSLTIPNPEQWTPDNPYLYDLKYEII